MNDLIAKGSKTAKDGFRNEKDVIDRFNNWQNDDFAMAWLQAMDYNLSEIEFVFAYKISGSFKADVQVKVEIKLKQLSDVQNLQLKLVSNPSGFNQIDKRWTDKYAELWEIPQNILELLKYFTGELPPFIDNPKDKRRMFINEFSLQQQEELLDFFRKKQSLIVCDILKGRGQFAAEWLLVILKIQDKEIKWALKSMNFCLNLFGNGEVRITPQGSIKIANIGMQRKGGDGGRKTAQMLQFKINPCLLFEQETQ
ncbi:MAG: type II restriction endonuclease [Pseudomonadota bacterium]